MGIYDIYSSSISIVGEHVMHFLAMNGYIVPCCDCDIVLYKMTWHFCTRSTCRYVLRDGLELDGWKFDRFPCENIDIIPFVFGMVMGRLRKLTLPINSTAQELFLFLASCDHFIYRVIKAYILWVLHVKWLFICSVCVFQVDKSSLSYFC